MAELIYTEEAKKETYAASLVNGGKVFAAKAVIKTPNAKSGDTIVFFKDIDTNLIPLELKISTSGSIGSAKIAAFYPDGTKIADLAAVEATAAINNKDCLAALTPADMDKTIGELTEIDETKFPGVNIGVTVAAAVTAPVALYGLFLQK